MHAPRGRLVGDLELDPEQGHKGEAWKHHNLRVSYIAQHSLHHLEEYLNETPMHYIQERFRLGMDREARRRESNPRPARQRESNPRHTRLPTACIPPRGARLPAEGQ